VDIKFIHQLLEPHLQENGVFEVPQLTQEELRNKYPKAAKLSDLLEKHMGMQGDRSSFPMTTLSITIAEKIESAKNRLELELIFIETAYSIQELYIGGFQKLRGLTDEQTDFLREQYREIVEKSIRPALNKALDEFYSIT